MNPTFVVVDDTRVNLRDLLNVGSDESLPIVRVRNDDGPAIRIFAAGDFPKCIEGEEYVLVKRSEIQRAIDEGDYDLLRGLLA